MTNIEFSLILFSFIILFLGELGDKTQLIIFNLALEYKKSYKVGIGATLGFAAIVSLGILIGSIITAYIPLVLISIVSGIIFIMIGLVDSRHLKKLYLEYKDKKNKSDDDENHTEFREETALSKKLGKFGKNPYLIGFIFIFLMELGDKTQILTITLVSIYQHPLEIWIGSFLALIILAWIGVFSGSIISKKIPKFHLKLISISIFIFIGIIILILQV
ncbi:MAG: TMEM165/GDT1 family protein [Promethearchaeota archaeon]